MLVKGVPAAICAAVVCSSCCLRISCCVHLFLLLVFVYDSTELYCTAVCCGGCKVVAFRKDVRAGSWVI
jgi:hypothetical protein